MAIISFSDAPSSANLAAAALCKPWAVQCGSPASSHCLLDQLSKPLALNGLPSHTVRYTELSPTRFKDF
jgi:hypothetical protein